MTIDTKASAAWDEVKNWIFDKKVCEFVEQLARELDISEMAVVGTCVAADAHRWMDLRRSLEKSGGAA